MLKRLSADNYRSLCNFELHPAELVLLIGNNGSGKTSLWEVLAGLQDLIVRGHLVDAAFPSDSLTRWRKDAVQRFELEAEASAVHYHYILEVAHDVERRTARVSREQLKADGALLYESEGGDVRLFGDAPLDQPRTPSRPTHGVRSCRYSSREKTTLARSPFVNSSPRFGSCRPTHTPSTP